MVKKEANVKKNKKNKQINSDVKFAIIASILLFVLIMIVLLIQNLPVKSDEKSNEAFVNKSQITHKIAKKLIKELGGSYKDSTIEDYGKDYQYDYSYSQFSNILYKDKDNYIINISKYNCKEEAESKVKFYNDAYNLTKNTVENSIYDFISNGTISTYLSVEDHTYYVKDNFLFVISNNVDDIDSVKDSIDKTMDKIKDKEKSNYTYNKAKVDKYWEEQLKSTEEYYKKIAEDYIKETKEEIAGYEEELNDCDYDECASILKKAKSYIEYDEFKDAVNKVQNKYNSVIKAKKDTVTSINSSISKLQKSLSQSEYDKIKERIDELSDPYFDTYKEGWKKKLSSLETGIYKKSCAKYNYKDLLRDPDKYYEKKAYFFGEIVQKVSDYEYRVNVDCKKYSYIKGYYCQNTIYVTYFGDVKLIEDDMVEFWGEMTITKTYESVMGASITIPHLRAEYAKLK